MEMLLPKAARFLLLLSIALVAIGAKGQPHDAEPIDLLCGQSWLTAADMATLDRGGGVARVVDTPDRSEVLSVVVMRIHTTPARVLEVLREVDGPQREPWIQQAGRLREAPYDRDFASMALDAKEVKDLAKCRLNNCEIRLPADAIDRFQKDVQWTSADAATQANALFRSILAAYARDYLSRGNAALFRYENNGDPVRIADSLELLRPRPFLLQDLVPDLYAHLDRFPQERPAGVEDFLYWMREKFWLLDVLSLNHVAIVDRTSDSGRLVVAVTKQLFATHYYESSLGVTAYSERGSVFLFVNRTRADIRRTGFTWVERSLLKFLVRSRLHARLRYLRQRLETT